MSGYSSSHWHQHVCNTCKRHFISDDYVDDYCDTCKQDWDD